MAKFSGMIGYAINSETAPGVFEDTIIERRHYGDVLSAASRWEQTEVLNDDLVISNRISIVADKFLRENLGAMKYALVNHQRWTIRKIEQKEPRFVLTLGGIYNGPTPT